MSKKRPHILIFNPDQMRADSLHHLGNEASVTPNMDKLTEEGVSFRHAFCQNPVCTPSRCSFMSGWYPHVRGHRSMHHMMHEDEPVLLKELKDEGYYVWMNGRNDLIPAQKDGYHEPYCNELFNPTKKIKRNAGNNPRGDKDSDNYYSFYRGKIENDEEGNYYDTDEATVEGAIDRIHNRPEDQPLCMFVPLIYPHPPYQVEEPYYSMIDRNKIPKRIETPENWEGKASILKGIHENQGMQNWTEERWTELRATYLGMCARVDHQLGMIIEALKEEGIYDDTAIFIFSDHGDYTGDYGIVEKSQNTFEDCLSNVPFIVKPPKDMAVKPGISDALVELIDFYATVEEMVGFKPTHTHFGRSLRNVISGEETEHRDAVFCEGGRRADETHCMEAGEDHTILDIENEYYPRMKMQVSDGPEHTKATMCRTKDFKYVRRLYEQDELYDLKNDPQEIHNIINDPAMKDIVAELKERTLTWYQDTCDVVPLELDQRMNLGDILARTGIKLPEETLNNIKKKMEGKILNSNTLKELMVALNLGKK